MTALAENVQHVPNGFWSLTGVTHPWSRESHDEGSGVDLNRFAEPFAPSAFVIFIRNGGGRNPVARASSPKAAIEMAVAQIVATSVLLSYLVISDFLSAASLFAILNCLPMTQIDVCDL